MRYLVMEYADKNNYTASSKARNDIVDILKAQKAIFIPFFKVKQNHLKIGIEIVCSIIKVFLKLKIRDEVYIQYPYQPQKLNELIFDLFRLTCSIKQAKLIVFLHDINSMRSLTDSHEAFTTKIKRECNLFRKPDYIVTHNKNMMGLIKKYGGRDNMLELGIFDYLYNGKPAKRHFKKDKCELVIAGNLSVDKCEYVYNLPETENIVYNLYGINYDEKKQLCQSAYYKGAFNPDELIAHIAGTFGLVWDGTSVDTCKGPTGEYLKFNNPHKASLYLAAGLPIIVWNKSALKDFVEDHNIGFAVGSLLEIEDLVKSISNDDYNKICTNVDRIATDLRKGKFTERILSQCGEA